MEPKTVPHRQIHKETARLQGQHPHRAHSSSSASPPKLCLLLAEQKAASLYLLMRSSWRMILPFSFSLLSKVLYVHLIVSRKPLLASFHSLLLQLLLLPQYCWIFGDYLRNTSVSCPTASPWLSLVPFFIPNNIISPITEYYTKNQVFYLLCLNILIHLVFYFSTHSSNRLNDFL